MDLNEPQIINYYNDLPEYAIIIENLNEEYDELITNYIRLNDRIDQYEKKPTKENFIGIFFVLLLFMILFEYAIIVILI